MEVGTAIKWSVNDKHGTLDYDYISEFYNNSGVDFCIHLIDKSELNDYFNESCNDAHHHMSLFIGKKEVKCVVSSYTIAARCGLCIVSFLII